uniref:NADAR domain-containing protein n=1 Tax=Panagrolaimus superbus TaxID=310955 RepID=A0A914Z1F6_9BILA
MSTFFEAPFKLKNHNYPNVETYYEACKLFCLIHYSCSTLVQKARYAAAAKKIASDVMKKYRIPRKVVDEWKLREGAQAVYNATHAKFDQNPDLKKKLLDTGDKFIVQCYEKDSIFGSGCTENELEDWFKKNNGKLIKIPIGVQIQSDKAIKVGNGRNLLGNFCMSIREEFRKMEEDMNSLQTLSLL